MGVNAPDYVLAVSPENSTRVMSFADRRRRSLLATPPAPR
jgi:hypothetical protein